MGLPVGLKENGYTIHSLRHFFETFAVNSRIPQPVVDAWMGHQGVRSMGKVYYELADAESQRFMGEVPFSLGTSRVRQLTRPKLKNARFPPMCNERQRHSLVVSQPTAPSVVLAAMIVMMSALTNPDRGGCAGQLLDNRGVSKKPRFAK